MKLKSLMMTALAVAIASYGTAAVAATIIIDDNFDSYANQSAFEAVWGSSSSGALTSAQSVSSPNSIRNAAGGTHLNSVNLASELIATDANPLVWSYMFYEDPDNISEGANTLGRSYGQLWGRNASGSLNQLLAIGHWNGSVAKVSDGSTPSLAETRTYYHARVAFTPGPSWRLMDTGPVRTAGWHEFKAVIGSTNVEFFIDGISVWTQAHSTAEGNTRWYHARIGSGLSSGTATNFDNYRLVQGIETVIPEPATFTLLGLAFAGVLLGARRRNG